MSTKKNIVDQLTNLYASFSSTDELKLDPDYLSTLIDLKRVKFIIRDYARNETIDLAWVSPPFFIDMHEVNIADDPTITVCNCNINKAFIPPLISLTNSSSVNEDLGIYALMSACANYKYYQRPMQLWNIPKEHTRAMFNYYARYNTTLYAKNVDNKIVDKLRLSPILASPEDGFFSNSIPIASGFIVSGTKYLVKYGSVIYNSTVYTNGQSFTAVGVTTFTGGGKIYLYSQRTAFNDTQDYPIGSEMIEEIILDILVKELKIQLDEPKDDVNDSVDDRNK